MKLSAGTIGTILFTAVATAAFVWMAKRPVVEGSAMNFGMPMPLATRAEDKAPAFNVPKEVAPEKMEEATSAPETSAPEPTSNADAPAESKTEELAPEAMPTDSTESPVAPEAIPATDAAPSPAG